MGTFTFQSAQVQTLANEIKAQGEDIRQILETKLPNAMQSLQNAWKSNAATAYNNQFQEIKAQFHIFYEAIENMSQSIHSVSTALNETDQANNVAGK